MDAFSGWHKLLICAFPDEVQDGTPSREKLVRLEDDHSSCDDGIMRGERNVPTTWSDELEKRGEPMFFLCRGLDC